MTYDQLDKFRARLCPSNNNQGYYFGCNSVKGFLAKGQILLDVVQCDLKTLVQNDISIQTIADSLFGISAILEMNKISKTEVNIVHFRKLR